MFGLTFAQITTLGGALLLASVPSSCTRTDMSIQNEYKLQIPSFHATSQGTSNAIDQAVAKHRELVSDLKKELTSGALSDEGKLYVIYFLGELRAADATSVLLENIDFVTPFVDKKGGIGRWGMYPAQEALVKVGTPALNMIVDKLPIEPKEERRQLMCTVMADVIGPATAIFMLQQAAAIEADKARKANLDDAIARLGKLK